MPLTVTGVADRSIAGHRHAFLWRDASDGVASHTLDAANSLGHDGWRCDDGPVASDDETGDRHDPSGRGSMTALRRRPTVVPALGLAVGGGLILGLGSIVAVATSEFVERPATTITLNLLVGWAFVVAGVIAVEQRPENRVGSLMLAVGFAWFLGQGGLAYAGSSIPFTIGTALQFIYIAVIGHLIVAFPSGSITTTAGRLVVAGAYLSVTVAYLPWMFFGETIEFCDRCPDNALLVTPNADASALLRDLSRYAGIAAALALVLFLRRRWHTSTASWRRAVAPVFWSAGLAFAVVVPAVANRAADRPLGDGPTFAMWLAFAVVPFGFLYGLLRSQLDRAAIADLVVELGEGGQPGRVEEALANALQDPTLVLGYWLPEQNRYVDVDGTPIELPDAGQHGTGTGDPQVTTVVEREGRKVAALIHDPSLTENMDLVEAACAGAGLALENERLHADLRARLNELQTSRARIVQATDDERRRIERNLHDGTQQRLVSLGLAVRLARAKMSEDPGAADELLLAAGDEIAQTLNEIVELTRGIHPALLTERGLPAALDALASRAQLPVTLSVDLDRRLPPPVEAALYYAASEALTNVAKHAAAETIHVDVIKADGRAVLEVTDDGVGGADPADGSGIRGLTDRIEALGGRLVVTSGNGSGTRLRVELPCG